MTRKPVRPILYKDNHALVALTQGKFCKIDIEDGFRVGKFNWYYTRSGYAGRNAPDASGVYYTQYLHSFINETPPHLITDHINSKILDNRKSNLRSVNHSQNQQNRRKRKTLSSRSSSKFKGVCRVLVPGRCEKWRARIIINRKIINLGGFESEEAAARAYNSAAVQLFGEYASLNFNSH